MVDSFNGNGASLSFNLLLDVFLVLFLFINIEELTTVVKLLTSLLILVVASARTIYYVRDRKKNDKGK